MPEAGHAEPARLRYGLDKDAIDSLRAMFAGTGGENYPRTLDKSRIDRAVEVGIMFASSRRALTHDQWVEACQMAGNRVDATQVAEAFLQSLDERRLDLRSALGSFALSRSLPAHPMVAGWHSSSIGECLFCALQDSTERNSNYMSYQRFVFGGSAWGDPSYAAFDLEQFRLAPRAPLCDSAVRIGRAMLDVFRDAPPEETAYTATRKLRMIKGTNGERAAAVKVLGMTGILRDANHRGFLNDFVPAAHREAGPNYIPGFSLAYPADWWQGGNGIDEDAVDVFLPQLSR